MQNRWVILFVLFFARTAMAFQFQSVGALSPLLIDSLALSLIEIGWLIGLYLGPGIIVAVLGGSVAAIVGDKRTVAGSIALMVLGSVVVLYATSLDWLIAGRVISGIGGVVVNVVMTKMVIDWFAGRSIATAMALFITSWPLGIALSLLVLPSLAAAGGLSAAWIGMIVVTAIALVLFLAIYRTPPGAVAQAGRIRVVALPWVPLIFAAVIWGLVNTAIAMVFGFGPVILAGKGLDPAGASSVTSLYMLAIAIAAPTGGWLADRTGQPHMVIGGALLLSAVLFPAMLYAPIGLAPLVYGLAGFVIGVCAGPVVSLPSYILTPDTRAFGMGIFYSLYYVLMMAAPPIAGALAEATGAPGIAFGLGVGMALASVAALAVFRVSARQGAAAA